jgi:GntR family transcriptional regulator
MRSAGLMPIDPTSHVPIYDQIVQHVRGSLAAGVFRPGELLPSTRALALELGVNPNTVHRAFQELERAGLILAVRGRGMAVAERGPRTAQEHAVTLIRETLARALKLAEEANLPAVQVRALFSEALNRARKPRTRAATPKDGRKEVRT